MFLEDKLVNQNPADPGPIFYYARKRSHYQKKKNVKGSIKITLDIFCRILYCYSSMQFEPRVVYDQAKRLWDIGEDNNEGLYLILFGKDSLENGASWEKSEINKAKVAISLYI